MLALGLMSGTSCDGIDAAVIETDGHKVSKFVCELHNSYDQSFARKLLSVMNGDMPSTYVEQELSELHCQIVEDITKTYSVKPDIIGFHGQTIFHDPSRGVSIQIGNPHMLAVRSGIDVVADFRRRDVAMGGQGAPLIPIFHKAIMKDCNFPLAVVNIGGVSNVTYINRDELLGYDLGPGNAYINDAMMRFFGKMYDEDGVVASSGNICQKLVDEFISSSYFDLPAPKSLDRNHFKDLNIDFLSPEDAIATLTMITAASIIKGLSGLDVRKIFVCGGGVHNKTMMKYIADIAPKNTEVHSLASLGFKTDFIEAQGFAFLAARRLKNLPSTFPSTTGVSQATFSGVIFPS